MTHTAATVYPSPLSWLGIGRELISGTPVLPAQTVPVGASYEPEDTPAYLRDANLRAAMTGLFGDTLGPEDSAFSFSGPAYLDVDGYWLDNLFGDLSTVSGGTLGTARFLSAPLVLGATSLTVGASLGAVTTGSVIQISDGAASEIVIATVGSTGTAVNFTGTPCRFAHTTGATAALQTAASNYTHTFAALNNGSGQPPTHSLTDFTGITPVVGARTYPSACVASLEMTGHAAQLLTRSVSGQAWISAPSSATPVNNTSAAAPVANWRATVTVGGSPVYNIGEWAASFKRDLVIYWAAQGSQSPWTIARGNLSAALRLEYSVAINETPLTQLFAPPATVVLTLSNGLAGAQALAMTLTMSQAQTVASKPDRTADFIGYSAGLEAIGNSTDIGGSGGLGPCTVKLTNAISTY